MLDFLDFVKALPIVNEAFKSDKYYAPANRVANAAINPDSKTYQRLYSANQQQGQNDLAFQIAELQRQNRKNTELGRTPLFSPERGGETIFRGLMKGYQDNQDQARRTTVDELNSGVSNLTGLGQQQQLGGLYRAAGIGRIADAFRPKTENERLLDTLKGMFNLG